MQEQKAGERKEKPGTISRREFLKDAGLVVGGATMSSLALLNACGGGSEGTITQTVTKTVSGTDRATVTVTASGSGAASITKVKFTVNKREYDLQVETGWTLQYLLHDKMGVTSIKDMCFGYGACGSCAAIFNGKPVVTCMVLAAECNGAIIETAEGIAEAKHPLIDAYVLNHCMQCGYCTPGFIVTAKNLLDRKPKPTEEDIREALGGNICRCGTYPQHILGILEASGQAKGG
jgi:aerobic-type carbon monoxide dehydrogenase small subunit (CoxS/CutS family)